MPLSSTALVLGTVLYLGDRAEEALRANDVVAATQERPSEVVEVLKPKVAIEAPAGTIQPVRAEEIVIAPVIVPKEETPVPPLAKDEPKVIGTLLPYRGEVPFVSLEFRRADLPK